MRFLPLCPTYSKFSSWDVFVVIVPRDNFDKIVFMSKSKYLMLSHFWTHASKLESIAGEKGSGQILFILKFSVMLTLLSVLCGHNTL